MLAELATYAYRHGLAMNPGFAPKSARWAIWLATDGSLIDVLDLQIRAGERVFPQSPELRQNELIAGGITRSHFLLDTVQVVTLLGVDNLDETNKDKVLAKHGFFVQLLEDAGAQYPVLRLCAEFLRRDKNLLVVRERLVAAKAKPTQKITFRVDKSFPIESSDWHKWWMDFRLSLADDGTKGNGKLMRCFQTGALAEPLRTHPKVKGLAAVGGQPAGCVLIGFDKEAFNSYGLEQSENAAVSEEAATIYVNALNDLVRKADRPIAGTLLIYWFKEDVPNEDDPLSWFQGLRSDNGEAQELEALQRAKEVVEGIRTGQRPDLANNTFHAAIISAAGGRVMVRDWQEGSFLRLAQHAVLWFEDLSICTRDGSRLARNPSLLSLMYSLVRQDLAEASPSLITEMWRSALFGRPIPRVVILAALQRIKAEIIDPAKEPNHARMGLIKAFHVRNARLQGGEVSLHPYLNEGHPSAAYQAGRLMAALAAIQRAALGDVGASVVQRYYAAASTTPALVLGRLVRQSQFHLNKLDRGLAVWYERLLAAIMQRLDDDLPNALTPEEQSLFALGYYQQMGSIYGVQHEAGSKEEPAHE